MRQCTVSSGWRQAVARVALGGVLALTGLETVAAQSLEGTWAIEVTPYDCASGTRRAPFWTIQSFAAGGTMTLVSANQLTPAPPTPALGRWSGAGSGAFTSTYIHFLLFGPTVQPWLHRVTQTIALTNDLLSGQARTEMFVAPGSLPAPTTPLPVPGCATIAGRRFP